MENQRRYFSKKPRIKSTNKLLSSTVLIFLMPIIAYILSYGFNIGYNSHFQIPYFLTSYSVTPIISNIPLLISFILIIIMFTIIILNFTRFIYNINIKESPKFKMEILFIIISSIILIFILITTNHLPLVIFSILMVVFSILMLINKITHNKTIKEAAKILHIAKNENKSKLDQIKIENFNIKLTHETKHLENLIYLYKIIIIILILMFIFLVFFSSMLLLGKYSAQNQKTFYVTNDNSIVINTFSENYITVPIYKEKSTFYFKSECTLVPMANTSIKLLHIPNLKPISKD